MTFAAEHRDLIVGLAEDFVTEIKRVRYPGSVGEARRVVEDAVFAAGACYRRHAGLEIRPRELGAMERTRLRMADRFVYAIQAGENGPVKIGQTINPAARLATLQQASWATLRGIAAWRACAWEEKSLHDEFAAARIRGEWFHPVPELLETVLWRGGEFIDWQLPKKGDE